MWQSSKCPSTDELYIHTHIHLMAEFYIYHEKECNSSVCSYSWPYRIVCSDEIMQRLMLYVISYMWNMKRKKYIYYRIETFSEYRDQISGYQWGEKGNIGVGDWNIQNSVYKINKQQRCII